ncbi:MAG: hypothetical protein AB8H79_26385 [Myxococcota bacterium]
MWARYAPVMAHWIRRIVTLIVIASLTAGGVLWWLYDGDMVQAVEPVVDDLVDDPAPTAPAEPTP